MAIEKTPINGMLIAAKSESWKQTAASFALEGITVTDEEADRAGRMLAGAITLEEGYAEIRAKYATPLDVLDGMN